MMIYEWDKLPDFLKIDEVEPYYEILCKKRLQLVIKRLFDFLASLLLIIILCPLFITLGLLIKLDSKGPIFYRQERVTQYGKIFKIHKFRSMIDNADQKGTLVTINNDSRITRIGRFIRKYKLDEISQLIDILHGDMSFVGTRPEVKKYVDCYTPEMLATLLLPAGITSTASVEYKNENEILGKAKNVDSIYINKILPEKMKMNLSDMYNFNLFRELFIMIKTVIAVIK